jgi:hypothetical protein
MRHTSAPRTIFIAALILAAALVAPSSRAQSAPTLTVDATGNPHPINPDIYGIANYGLDANFAKEIQIPNIRWGGDGTTRYNWQVDSSNAGFDWYFMGGNGQSTVTPSGSADTMISTYKAASNAHTLLTIPIIPYVNKSAAWNCSYPVSVYGAQQSTNPYVHPNGDNCGNSLTTSGAQITDTNIYANHIDNTVALQQGWIQHLVSTFGTAANGGVPYYQLDNEPGGWSNTHRDVEPNQPDYDTIISLGQQYAAIIKSTDPSAKVFGPVDFTLGGWIGTPSKQNNLYAGQYYLQQMAAYDAANHQRILDYFDEHYYGGGSTDAAELDSTRALWDPTFNSGSWVEQYYFDGPMDLLPRFQSWIQTYYPGTKLAISEYSFSSGTNPLVDALTEADVLGIYGRQGLDFANYWIVPKPTEPVAYSFRVYRNYDGAGSQFGDVAVNSTSTDQSQLSVYGATRSKDGALTVVVINKTTAAIQTSLALSNFNSSASAAVFTYSNANLGAIVAGSPVTVGSNSVNYNFPAYSITVFVFTAGAGAPAATTTTVSASTTTPTQGQSVTFSATVVPTTGGGSPTGTVAFFDAATQLGAGTLTSGSATYATSALSAGSHTITAQYSGDTNFAASTSTAVSVTVSGTAKTATQTTMLASGTQLNLGDKLTLSLGVAPTSGNGTPTGSVVILDGSTQIASVTLTASAGSFSTTTLAAGSHTLTAQYSGDSDFAASNSSAVTVTVSSQTKAASTTALNASATQISAGESVSFTAHVAPASGTGSPTGTVAFLDGGFQIGTGTLASGAAQFATSTLAAGKHTITAAYSGDSNFTPSSSGAAGVTVTTGAQPDYTITAATPSLTIKPGDSGSSQITITPENGFKQALTFACSGLPSGGTCTFSPQSVTPSGAAASTTVKISVPALAAARTTSSAISTGGDSHTTTGAQLFAASLLTLFAIFGFVSAGKRELAIASRVKTRARRIQLVPAAATAFALVAMLVTVSCAGFTSNGSTPPPDSQSYTVTITASGSGAPTHTATITVTVP